LFTNRTAAPNNPIATPAQTGASPNAPATSQYVPPPHPASTQDRDGGGPLLRASRRIFPFIQRVFADSGYAAERVAKATLIVVEIVRKNPDQVGFTVNPRRWVVEQFFAWIGRNRRLAKDFEATIDSARDFLCRINHAARAPDCPCFMTFETDSRKLGLIILSIQRLDERLYSSFGKVLSSGERKLHG